MSTAVISRPTTGPSPTPAAARMARSDLLAVAPSIVPFGVALGVTISALVSVGGGAGVLGAGLVYAGTAQLSAMTMLEHGTAAAAVVASAAIVNSRLLLYGAALEPSFRRQPLWFRLLGVQFVIDATYVAAAARPDVLRDRAGFRRYWLWLGVLLLVLWTGSVGVGVLVGPLVPDLPHLGLLGLALFVSLLVPRLVDAPSLAAAGAAAVVGPLATVLVPELGIVAGSLAGVLAGSFTAARRTA